MITQYATQKQIIRPLKRLELTLFLPLRMDYNPKALRIILTQI